MAEIAEAVVIGGGCIGTSIAWQLARRGVGRVLLLERSGKVGGPAGWPSAMVHTHLPNLAMARMALRARRLFEHFAAEVAGHADFHRAGYLALLAPEMLGEAEAQVAEHQRIGIATEIIGPAEIARLEPRLSLGGVAAAVWEPDSGYVEPQSATAGFAEAARRTGVDLRLGVGARWIGSDPHGVCLVATDDEIIATRTVVVAAGFRTRDLLSPLEIDLPLTPVRHTVAALRRTRSFGPRHPMVADLPEGSYYQPEGAALTLIGATSAHAGAIDPHIEQHPPPPPGAEQSLIDRYAARFPGVERGQAQPGHTGVFDCTPDLLPILGPVPGVDGLLIAAGFSGQGLTLSPVVGELLADQILHGGSRLVDLGQFGLGRFG